MAVSLQFRLVFLLLFCTICLGEQRDIYLVMVGDDPPVAFLQDDSSSLQSDQMFDPEMYDPSSETLKIRHAKHLEETHDQLLQSTLEQGSYNKLYSFNHIVNGFAVHTTHTQANKLKNAPGVKLVEKDTRTKLMTTHTPNFLGIPRGVWHSKRGETDAGKGIVIGFVDSGINPSHPSFAYDPRLGNDTRFPRVCQEGPMFPRGSCNGKLISARFFAAGAVASGHLNASVDILSPFDVVGHGSHVAATAAGNHGIPVVVNGFNYGRSSGMAPRARIAVYKAIYPSMGTATDVLAAMDQAAKDGVDILTLSIGPEEPANKKFTMLSMFDIFMLYARKAGVLVVQAGGNGGPNPYTIMSYSPWAVGVAACKIDRTYHNSIALGNGQKLDGIGLSAPSVGEGLVHYKLVLAKDAALANGSFPRSPEYIEECQHPEALDPDVVRRSIVICMFSSGFYNYTSSVETIINTGKTLGFAGFVFLANPAYGDFIAEPYPFSIPGLMITKVSDAKVVMEYYEKHTERNDRGVAKAFHGRAALGEGRVASYDARAPIVTRYSSRGPNVINDKKTPLDLLKPDILAPGHNIWAAWSSMSIKRPLLVGYEFGFVSGTSMAAPHIAGVAALIKQRNPSWSPAMIASAMATTATAYDNRGEPIMAEGNGIHELNRSTPFDHGAGLVNPTHAIDPGLVFMSGYEDYMRFLCSQPNTDRQMIKTTLGETCRHSFLAPADLNTPSITISALAGSQLVKRTVKNVAKKVEMYVCAVVPPAGVAVEVNPPWFTIVPEGTQDFEVMLNVTEVKSSFSHGEIVLTGSLRHIVRIPLSVLPVSMG